MPFPPSSRLPSVTRAARNGRDPLPKPIANMRTDSAPGHQIGSGEPCQPRRPRNALSAPGTAVTLAVLGTLAGPALKAADHSGRRRTSTPRCFRSSVPNRSIWPRLIPSVRQDRTPGHGRGSPEHRRIWPRVSCRGLLAGLPADQIQAISGIDRPAVVPGQPGPAAGGPMAAAVRIIATQADHAIHGGPSLRSILAQTSADNPQNFRFILMQKQTRSAIIKISYATRNRRQYANRSICQSRSRIVLIR